MRIPLQLVSNNQPLTSLSVFGKVGDGFATTLAAASEDHSTVPLARDYTAANPGEGKITRGDEKDSRTAAEGPGEIQSVQQPQTTSPDLSLHSSAIDQPVLPAETLPTTLLTQTGCGVNQTSQGAEAGPSASDLAQIAEAQVPGLKPQLHSLSSLELASRSTAPQGAKNQAILKAAANTGIQTPGRNKAWAPTGIHAATADNDGLRSLAPAVSVQESMPTSLPVTTQAPGSTIPQETPWANFQAQPTTLRAKPEMAPTARAATSLPTGYSKRTNPGSPSSLLAIAQAALPSDGQIIPSISMAAAPATGTQTASQVFTTLATPAPSAAAEITALDTPSTSTQTLPGTGTQSSLQVFSSPAGPAYGAGAEIAAPVTPSTSLQSLPTSGSQTAAQVFPSPAVPAPEAGAEVAAPFTSSMSVETLPITGTQIAPQVFTSPAAIPSPVVQQSSSRPVVTSVIGVGTPLISVTSSRPLPSNPAPALRPITLPQGSILASVAKQANLAPEGTASTSGTTRIETSPAPSAAATQGKAVSLDRSQPQPVVMSEVLIEPAPSMVPAELVAPPAAITPIPAAQATPVSSAGEVTPTLTSDGAGQPHLPSPSAPVLNASPEPTQVLLQENPSSAAGVFQQNSDQRAIASPLLKGDLRIQQVASLHKASAVPTGEALTTGKGGQNLSTTAADTASSNQSGTQNNKQSDDSSTGQPVSAPGNQVSNHVSLHPETQTGNPFGNPTGLPTPLSMTAPAPIPDLGEQRRAPEASSAGSGPAGDAAGVSVADTHAAPINSARVIQSMQGSEMRVGMHSAEFGNVSISTSFNRQSLAAEISFEHTELGRALTAHLPSIETKLSSELGVQARVEVRDQSRGTLGDTAPGQQQSASDQGGGRQARQAYAGSGGSLPTGSPTGVISGEAPSILGEGIYAGGARLDIRI